MTATRYFNLLKVQSHNFKRVSMGLTNNRYLKLIGFSDSEVKAINNERKTN